MRSGILKHYKYRGAGVLVILHEQHLKSFIRIWRQAETACIRLPETDDPDYNSMKALLQHVLRSARGYMIWMCEKLDLPEPGISHPPEVQTIEEEADAYLDHLLEKWRVQLADIPEEKFFTPIFSSRWGPEYCIEAMLEHAVMHPIRHEFQLRNLIDEQVTEFR